ncbi:MAG: neuromedin U [Geminicoccaceae bacterium]
MIRQRSWVTAGILLLTLCSGVAVGQEEAKTPSEEETRELAKQAQNPIANLISVPFQNNTQFNFGPRERTLNVLNFQPVIPFKLNENWNLITRTIVPFIHLPSSEKGDSSDNGIGDVNPTFFFATSLARDLMVGFGPTFTLPTATKSDLGTEKWSAGPAGVVVWTPGKWVVGTLVNNQWSFAGDSDRKSVNQMLVQPFVNYNIADGWYLISNPIVTANWEAGRSKDTWTVPVGGGVGRLFHIGKLPINASIQAFDYVEKPEYGADWELRAELAFLFPK